MTWAPAAMLAGILENCQMGGGELMRHTKVCRTLVEGENTQGSYSKVAGWLGSNDGDAGAVKSVIFVKVKGRSVVLNGRHLLQQNLKAGCRRGGESLTVRLPVLSTHTGAHTHTHPST